MSSPFFRPFLSCPSQFSAVHSHSAFVSPSVSSSPPFLVPPPSSSSFVSWCSLTAETRSRAPPFYLRIVRRAIPYSSFVTLFFLSHCPLALLPSRRTLTPSDFTVIFSLSLLSTKIARTMFSCLQHPYPLSPDNDCYRLMRVCILVAVSRRIQSATRSAGTHGRGRARSQPSHRKMRDALFASIFGTILK